MSAQPGRMVGEMKEFVSMSQDMLLPLGLTVSVEHGCKLSEAMKSIDQSSLEWRSLEDATYPVECLRHWLSENTKNFSQDQFVNVWESLYFIVAEHIIFESQKLAALLVFDVYDQETKIILFRWYQALPTHRRRHSAGAATNGIYRPFISSEYGLAWEFQPRVQVSAMSATFLNGSESWAKMPAAKRRCPVLSDVTVRLWTNLLNPNAFQPNILRFPAAN